MSSFFLLKEFVMLNSVLEFIKTFNMTQFTGAFIVLFAIIDIIGTLPIVMNLQRNGRIVSAPRASIISFVLFVGFMYMGIIFIIAMEMVLDLEIFRSNSSTGNDATFTPVVFPLIAGAGSFTTLLSIRSQYSDFNILLAVLANVLIVYFALKSSKKLEKILSPGIICIFQKAFGIILLSISVKLFTSNLTMIVENISKCAE